MKKIIIIFSLLFLQFVIAKGQNITISNGMMKFSSLEIFEQYSEGTLNYDDIQNASTQITTLKQTENLQNGQESIYPEFLVNILNVNKIFGVGNFIIKLDLENERALVCKINNLVSYNNLLNNNLTNGDIFEFSKNVDNVYEVLEKINNNELNIANYKTAIENVDDANQRCGSSAREKKQHFPREEWDRWKVGEDDCLSQTRIFEMDRKVVYQRFIIYFSLQSKIKSMSRCGTDNGAIEIGIRKFTKLYGLVKYVKQNNCSYEWNRSTNLEENSRELNWRPYEGTRALKRYDFRVTFGIKHEAFQNYSCGDPCEIRIIDNY